MIVKLAIKELNLTLLKMDKWWALSIHSSITMYLPVKENKFNFTTTITIP